jgi:hypothetical protein
VLCDRDYVNNQGKATMKVVAALIGYLTVSQPEIDNYEYSENTSDREIGCAL